MAISLTSTSTTSTITANSADILTSDSSGEVSLRTGGSLKEIPVAVKDALNATGTAPIYAARAWVNFDGTTTPPTIRASGNVSSVARNATGVFTINLTTAMPNANYSVVEGGTRNPAQNNADGKTTIRDLSTSSFKVITFASTNPVNHKIILVSVFG